MNRNTRMLIVVGIAVVTAALASLGVYQAIRHMPILKVETPSVYIVVAAKPVEMGVLLTKEHVKVVPWPEHSPIAGSFAQIEKVVDRGLTASLLENEPITESKLASLQAGAGLPPVIRPGMRAMSVKVNEVIGVAGFVVPGARVDVLVTIRQQNDSMSRVVVSNVQVLTAGTRYDQGEAQKDGKPIPTTVVTLMVPPADAERIALAASEGQIMLALRNPLDGAATSTSGIRTAGLLGTAPAAIAPPPVPGRAARRPPVVIATGPVESVAPSRPRTVETYKATKRGSEVVQ
jgi:pilus assembly protein CpaB